MPDKAEQPGRISPAKPRPPNVGIRHRPDSRVEGFPYRATGRAAARYPDGGVVPARVMIEAVGLSPRRPVTADRTRMPRPRRGGRRRAARDCRRGRRRLRSGTTDLVVRPMREDHCHRPRGAKSGVRVVINARTDNSWARSARRIAPLAVAVDRGKAFPAAGADCVFVPGLLDRAYMARSCGHRRVDYLTFAEGTPPIPELGTGVARQRFRRCARRSRWSATSRGVEEGRHVQTFWTTAAVCRSERADAVTALASDQGCAVAKLPNHPNASRDRPPARRSQRSRRARNPSAVPRRVLQGRKRLPRNRAPREDRETVREEVDERTGRGNLRHRTARRERSRRARRRQRHRPSEDRQPAHSRPRARGHALSHGRRGRAALARHRVRRDCRKAARDEGSRRSRRPDAESSARSRSKDARRVVARRGKWRIAAWIATR